MEEMVDDNTRAKEGLNRGKDLWKSMWECNKEYADMYKKGGASQANVSAGSTMASS